MTTKNINIFLFFLATVSQKGTVVQSGTFRQSGTFQWCATVLVTSENIASMAHEH